MVGKGARDCCQGHCPGAYRISWRGSTRAGSTPITCKRDRVRLRCAEVDLGLVHLGTSAQRFEALSTAANSSSTAAAKLAFSFRSCRTRSSLRITQRGGRGGEGRVTAGGCRPSSRGCEKWPQHGAGA